MKFDEITKAAHYNSLPAKCTNCQHPIECIDVIKHLPTCEGTAMKYLWRAPYKTNQVQDLEKARQYCTYAIDLAKEFQELRTKEKIQAKAGTIYGGTSGGSNDVSHISNDSDYQ